MGQNRQVDARSADALSAVPVTRAQYTLLPAQYTERLPVPVMLAGHDPLRLLAMRKRDEGYAR